MSNRGYLVLVMTIVVVVLLIMYFLGEGRYVFY